MENNGQIYLKQVNKIGRNGGLQEFSISSSLGTDLQNVVTISGAILSFKDEGALIFLELK